MSREQVPGRLRGRILLLQAWGSGGLFAGGWAAAGVLEAGEAREDPAGWQARAVTQRLRFISRIFCFFFFFVSL